MSKKILRLPQVKEITGLSRSSIYAFIKQKKFPSSFSLGPRSQGWTLESIENWIESRINNPKGGVK